MHIYKHHFSEKSNKKQQFLENRDVIFYCAANDINFKIMGFFYHIPNVLVNKYGAELISGGFIYLTRAYFYHFVVIFDNM